MGTSITTIERSVLPTSRRAGRKVGSANRGPEMSRNAGRKVALPSAAAKFRKASGKGGLCELGLESLAEPKARGIDQPARAARCVSTGCLPEVARTQIGANSSIRPVTKRCKADVSFVRLKDIGGTRALSRLQGRLRLAKKLGTQGSSKGSQG